MRQFFHKSESESVVGGLIGQASMFNSLAPGGFHYSLKLVNFELISKINIWSIFCVIAIRWMPQYLTDH